MKLLILLLLLPTLALSQKSKTTNIAHADNVIIGREDTKVWPSSTTIRADTSMHDLSRNDTSRGVVYYIKAGNKPDIQWAPCIVVDSVVAKWSLLPEPVQGIGYRNAMSAYIDHRVRRTIKLWDGTFLDPDKFYSFISETQFQR
jgi:hypothetical protein